MLWTAGVLGSSNKEEMVEFEEFPCICLLLLWGLDQISLGNRQNVSVWEMSVYSASNRLNLGMLDLRLPSNGGREAGGVDLKPKSLSCERALGAACPGGAATVPWGAAGTSPSLLDSSCSYPSVLTPGPQIPSLFFGVLLFKSS